MLIYPTSINRNVKRGLVWSLGIVVKKTEFRHLQKGRFSAFQENDLIVRAKDGIGLLINTALPASGDVKQDIGHFLEGTL